MFTDVSNEEIEGNFKENSFIKIMRKNVVGGELVKAGHFTTVGKLQ